MGLCAVLTNPRGSEEYLSDSQTRYWTDFNRVWVGFVWYAALHTGDLITQWGRSLNC